MSDEHIDRSLKRVPGPHAPALRAAVESAIVSAQRAISAYWAVEQRIPLFITNGVMAPTLPEHLFQNARLLPSRAAIFDHIPKGGHGLEIGTQTGAFARQMLERAHPRVLELIDITYEQFDANGFAADIASGRVVRHEGASWDILPTFENERFDWIYLDASHAYEPVTRDIEAAWRKVKPGGWFIFNDFTNWSPLEMTPYGVMQAVCDFLIEQDGAFEVGCLALHRLGYHDIGLRRKAGA